jgi:hypothetical protein
MAGGCRPPFAAGLVQRFFMVTILSPSQRLVRQFVAVLV